MRIFFDIKICPVTDQFSKVGGGGGRAKRKSRESQEERKGLLSRNGWIVPRVICCAKVRFVRKACVNTPKMAD